MLTWVLEMRMWEEWEMTVGAKKIWWSRKLNRSKMRLLGGGRGGQKKMSLGSTLEFMSLFESLFFLLQFFLPPIFYWFQKKCEYEGD